MDGRRYSPVGFRRFGCLLDRLRVVGDLHSLVVREGGCQRRVRPDVFIDGCQRLRLHLPRRWQSSIHSGLAVRTPELPCVLFRLGNDGIGLHRSPDSQRTDSPFTNQPDSSVVPARVT